MAPSRWTDCPPSRSFDVVLDLCPVPDSIRAFVRARTGRSNQSGEAAWGSVTARRLRCLGAQLAISVHNCPVLADTRFPMSIFKRTQRKHVKKAYRVRNWREYEAGLCLGAQLR